MSSCCIFVNTVSFAFALVSFYTFDIIDVLLALIATVIPHNIFFFLKHVCLTILVFYHCLFVGDKDQTPPYLGLVAIWSWVTLFNQIKAVLCKTFPKLPISSTWGKYYHLGVSVVYLYVFLCRISLVHLMMLQ